MLLIILLFVLGLYVVTYLIFHKRIYSYWKKRNVPGPNPISLFGNIWEIIILRKTVDSFVYELYTTYTKHQYVGFYNMCKPALLIRDPNLIKDILIKDFDYFHSNWYVANRKVDPLFGCSPFVLKGKEWKETRSLVTPAFTGAKIKAVFPLMNKVSEDMVLYITKLQQDTDSEPIEVTDLCARYTGENTMSCGYGLNANSFSQDTPETYKVAGSTADPLGFSMSIRRTLALYSEFIQKILNTTFAGNPTSGSFKEFITRAVTDRLKNNIIHNDFLNHLMNMKNRGLFDHDDLVGHAFTMFFDAFQTSFAAMAYALLELSLNPDVQNAARNDIRRALEKNDGEISYDTIQDLKYLENVVFETLRKDPVLKIMVRVCNQRYNIKDASGSTLLTVEKGTPVYLSVRGLHSDPEYYPDPEKFDPHRFTEEENQARLKCSFLGFGDGPRICLGRRFAMAQLLQGLAVILLNYDLKLNKKTTFPIKQDYFHISNIPISGIYIDFIRRKEKDFP